MDKLATKQESEGTEHKRAEEIEASRLQNLVKASYFLEPPIGVLWWRRCPKCDKKVLKTSKTFLSIGLGYFSQWDIRHYWCENCDYEYAKGNYTYGE